MVSEKELAKAVKTMVKDSKKHTNKQKVTYCDCGNELKTEEEQRNGWCRECI